MKTHLSVRIDAQLASWLDSYRESHKLKSRSLAFENAIKALREKELYVQYGQAFDEWTANSETRPLWDKTTADGLEDEDATWRHLLDRP
jgi:Tfp pilus assembly protein PilX